MPQRPVDEAFAHAHRALTPVVDKELSESATRMRALIRFIVEHTGGYEGKRVLDLGCSVGFHLVVAKRLGAKEAVGVDKYIFPNEPDNAFRLSQASFDLVSHAWKENGVQVLPHDAGGRLPFPDGSFDLIVSNAMIEHLHGTHKAAFAEAHRLLAPGGRFVVTTPNLAKLLNRVRFLFGRSPSWDFADFFESGEGFTGHAREFTIAEARQMFARTGFTDAYAATYNAYATAAWLAKPKHWHHLLLSLVSEAMPDGRDILIACGRKP